MSIADKIVAIARAEIGVEEIDGSNCGPRVNEYKAATNLPHKEAWPWCAAFIDWIVMQAMAGESYTFKRPTTAGAWDLERWSREQDESTQTKRYPGNDIRSGDIIIFTFSHVGLAVGGPNRSLYVPSIEGNTDAEGSREGGGVWQKMRHISKIKTRIRFTV